MAKKKTKISPIFKKRLDFFRHLAKVSLHKQKKILRKGPPKISKDLIKLIKVVKRHPIPRRHLKKITPFRKTINNILKNKKKSRNFLAGGIKGGFLSALVPLIATLASTALPELIKII